MNAKLRAGLLAIAVLAGAAGAYYGWSKGVFERPGEPLVVAEQVSGLIAALEKEQSFSGVVVIAQGDKVLFSRASGLADRVTGRPMTIETGFATSSMGKMFTSMLVHRMAQEGKLDLDAKLDRYLPDSKLPGADQVTLRQLLTHTSGYGNHFSHPLYEQAMSRGGGTRAELLRMIRETPLVSAPGQQWRYSNAGYVVLGWVVEAVSGKGFGEVLQTQLLGPVGASIASVETPLAAGHRALTQGVFHRTNAPVHPVHTGMGDGGWMLKAADLHRVASALHGNRIPGLNDWKGTLASLHDLRDNDGFKTRYGAGLMETRFKGLVFVGHDGASDGWSTDLRVNPEDGMTFIVLSNNSEVVSLDVVNKLIRTVYGLPTEAPKPQRKTFLVGLLDAAPYETLLNELNPRLQAAGFEPASDPMTLIEVAEALQRASFNDLALKAHQLNLAMFPNMPPAYGAYGEYLYWVEKSPQKALQHFKAMRAKFPEDGYARQRFEEISEELHQ